VYFHPLSNLTNHDKNARNKTKSDPNMLNDDFSIFKHARNCLIDVVWGYLFLKIHSLKSKRKYIYIYILQSSRRRNPYVFLNVHMYKILGYLPLVYSFVAFLVVLYASQGSRNTRGHDQKMSTKLSFWVPLFS
jgi:hypothetical protein